MKIVDRRDVLRAGLGLSGAVLLGGTGARAQEGTAPADTTRSLGETSSPVGSRSPFENPERIMGQPGHATASFTPLEVLHGVITPSDLHFERHHAGIPVVDPSRYELMIHGLVDRPMKFSLEDLRAFPATTRTHFIECSGNGRRAALPPESLSGELSPGQLDGLLSTSEWTGVKLSTLMHEVGARSAATWFVAEGQDGAEMSRSIPMSKAWDDAMIVYAQNGEAIRPEQGYPARLLLPGYEGNTSVKWLRRIELTDAPQMGREETAKYTDAMADGRVRQFSLQMAPKSLITSPSYPVTMQRRGWHEIRGVAWSGGGRIARVEVSIDGGRSWREARLEGQVLDKCAVRFCFGFDWQGEERLIMSRATDENGDYQLPYVENEANRGPGTFYHNNAIRPWKIHRDGRVTFAMADMAG